MREAKRIFETKNSVLIIHVQYNVGFIPCLLRSKKGKIGVVCYEDGSYKKAATVSDIQPMCFIFMYMYVHGCILSIVIMHNVLLL